MRNFLYMLASQSGGIWNAENYARALGVSATTIKRYLDFLEGAFLARQLPAWSVNAGKRLTKAPKVYIRDSGLLHILNRIQTPAQLPLHLIVGASWEGYVVEQISQLKPNHIDLYYYRTHQGAECDLLLVNGLEPIMAVEIKYSSNPSVPKGFYIVLDDLKLKQGHVIIPKNAPFRLNEQVQCSNLQHFLTRICRGYSIPPLE